MTGVQTCALPICFPVTIRSRNKSSRNDSCSRNSRREIKKEISISDKINGETIQRKIKLTNEQHDDFEQEARKLINDKVEKLNELPEFKNADIETQVQLRTMVENSAVREAQNKIEKRYRSEFPKLSEEEKSKLEEKLNIKKEVKKHLKMK